jgi:dolichol-phosphate mannosyltransferase
MRTTPDISVVIPLLNEEGNINILYDLLKTVLEKISPDFEILFVDDGSTDTSFELIRSLSEKDKRVTGLSLSRNFGHQVALTAGLEHAKGKAVVTMDADLQHPPELISQLYEEYKKGFDIVNTIRKDPDNIGWFKKATSSLFYKLINYLSDVRIQPAAADFRLMSRKAVNAFMKIRERDRFTRGLVSWMGFRQATIEYMAASRFAGKSKYTLKRMIRFASDGITSFSSRPLRVSFYLGLIVLAIGIIYSGFAIYEYFQGVTVQGWTSTLLTIIILGSIQLISIGVLGEYIARVFNEAKGRPLYFLKENLSEPDNQEQ